MRKNRKKEGQAKMEFEQMITLIKTVSDSTLTAFKYEEKGVKITLEKKMSKEESQKTFVSSAIVEGQGEKTVSATAVSSHTSFLEEGKEQEAGHIVHSPLVGVFYAAPSEEAEPFVKKGDTVLKGQTLAIVEAMKLMNEIESDYDGTVVEIFAENGQAVEYGQPLFQIS
jgi:acetyl-CoA carboxylase biotin carboxyl carrier protein